MNVRAEWEVIIDLLTKTDPILLYRLSKRMTYYLFKKNIRKIDELIKELENVAERSERDGGIYSNMPHPKMSPRVLDKFVKAVFQIANENLWDEEITEQLSLWLSQERGRFLALATQNLNISLVDITTALNKFSHLPKDELCISQEEYIGLRVALIRRFLTFNLSYINIAKRYITVRDFCEIVKCVIGPGQGSGRLGGKTSGMLLAYKILESAKQEYADLEIKVPKSWFITSDTMFDFLQYNALEEFINLKYMHIDEIRHGYPYLQHIYKNSFFSPEIEKGLSRILDEVGDKPIIIRSSSLLEDSFVASFSGKYKSLFLANTGKKEERLSAMLDAIAEVYASTFGPDPIEYRKEKGLLDFNEEMGILIQEVVGNRVGNYFFPTFAGVGFSTNEFRWSPRIRREDGAIRIVAGLGTRAVDRVSNDYPFLISPGKPGLRVNITYEDKKRYSQQKIDVLNLETNKFETLPAEELLKKYYDEIPGLNHIVSIDKDGYLSAPMAFSMNGDNSDLIVTFQGLIEKTPFLKKIKIVMELLAKAFNYPVDIEFASDGRDLYILQCRPQAYSKLMSEDISVPENISEFHKIFSASRYITTSQIRGIEYIVYIPAEKYSSLETLEDMKNIAKIVGKLNSLLPKRKFILIGPGRWGSRGDIKLGVSVTYSDINNTAMLIEVARAKGNCVPELSFGTHFFQDLVEADIRYLPLYPDIDKTIFNETFLLNSKNKLSELLPEYKDFEYIVKVINIPENFDGDTLSIIMDGKHDRALAFIE